MLNNDRQEILVERLINRIEKLNEDILTTIGTRIKEIRKLTPSQAHQIKQMLVYGEDIEKIVQQISKITNMNIVDIYNIFNEEARINQGFAKTYYEASGIQFVPYLQNKALKQQVEAIASLTAKSYMNVSNTTAIGYTIRDMQGNIIFKDISNVYRETIDSALFNITQGKTTYDQEMRRIIKQLGTSGLKTIDYESGRVRRLDSAIRMNMLDGMRQLTNELQQQFGEEFGANGIEISVHSNPAVDHSPIQGHQFSNEEYNNMQNSLPFKDYEGNQFNAIERHISEWNCYHYVFSIVLGVNKPEYSKEQLQTIIDKNNKGFILDGRHYTNYEGTQLQRKLETQIRKQKDLQILAKASEDKELVQQAQRKITYLTTKYKQLSQISGLPTKMERLRVTGYRRINVNKM